MKTLTGPRVAWKLFRLRADGSLGSLFIERDAPRPSGKWLKASFNPTQGYAPRRGWHVMPRAAAPHLSTRGRVWVRVLIKDYTAFERPASQGGRWFLAKWMRIGRAGKR